jgi:hypothetical protein
MFGLAAVLRFTVYVWFGSCSKVYSVCLVWQLFYGLQCMFGLAAVLWFTVYVWFGSCSKVYSVCLVWQRL